jgi:hypothetical protein
MNTITLSLSQSQASIVIEALVQAIESTQSNAFHVTTSKAGFEQVSPTRISKHFQSIQQLLNLYDDRYDYSEHLQVFWSACSDIGLERGHTGPVCLDATGFRYLSFAQSMNALVVRIRQLTCTADYQRNTYKRRYRAQDRASKIEDYTRAVLARYSRAVVVRVDLHYLGIVDPWLRIEHLYSDLERLIRARERNPIFTHETGYIWSVEQGKDKGFHVHTAFFFNGAHVRSDWHKAHEIGALWQQITADRGYYYSCNDDKSKYLELGIGTVIRADLQACENVVTAMSYLAKEAQHLRIKPLGSRTFGTGQVPR